MPALTVVPVPDADLDRVGAICVDAYVASGLVDVDSPYVAALRDVAARIRETVVLAAYDGARPVGSVTLAAGGTRWAEVAQEGEAELRMLAVAPEAQGRGVALTLVRAAVETAEEMGAETLVLTSSEDQAVAARRYLAAGFERAPERDWQPEWYTSPAGDPLTVPVWERTLGRVRGRA